MEEELNSKSAVILAGLALTAVASACGGDKSQTESLPPSPSPVSNENDSLEVTPTAPGLSSKAEEQDTLQIEGSVSGIPTPNPYLDTDNDGLFDIDEMTYQTDIYDWDTDGDFIPDGKEIHELHTDPLSVSTNGVDDPLTELKHEGFTIDNSKGFDEIVFPEIEDSTLSNLLEHPEQTCFNISSLNMDTPDGIHLTGSFHDLENYVDKYFALKNQCVQNGGGTEWEKQFSGGKEAKFVSTFPKAVEINLDLAYKLDQSFLNYLAPHIQGEPLLNTQYFALSRMDGKDGLGDGFDGDFVGNFMRYGRAASTLMEPHDIRIITSIPVDSDYARVLSALATEIGQGRIMNLSGSKAEILANNFGTAVRIAALGMDYDAYETVARQGLSNLKEDLSGQMFDLYNYILTPEMFNEIVGILKNERPLFLQN